MRPEFRGAGLAWGGRAADRDKFPYPMFIILDLTLPRMTCLEFLNWLRQQPQLAHTPVIVLTASVYGEDIRKAYELDAKTFFSKPLEIHDLDQSTLNEPEPVFHRR